MKQTFEFFSPTDLHALDPSKLPRHIAIIPDGNRRWAQSKFLPVTMGHVAGADNAVQIARAAKELGIKVVTLYTFSTENWKRPRDESDHFMNMMQHYLERYQQKLIENDVSLKVIGNIDGLGSTLRAILEQTCERTAHCKGFEFVIAINYGGRDEIMRAIKKMVSSKIDPETICQEMISQFLDTKNLPDPDLVIRTSGEMRLSNFLLWQCSYSELYVDNIAWPDFTPQHLLKAVLEYQGRSRRIGGK